MYKSFSKSGLIFNAFFLFFTAMCKTTSLKDDTVMKTVKSSWKHIKQFIVRWYPLILFLTALLLIVIYKSFFLNLTILKTSSMALIYVFRKNGTGSCAGIFYELEGNYYVQTAAHCVNEAEDIYLYPGIANLSLLTADMRIPVEMFKIDERFDPITLKHDVAFLKLNSSVKQNTNITFEKWSYKKPTIKPGQICEVWGWASPNSSIGLTSDLNKIPVNITNGKGELCKDLGLIFAENNDNLVVEGYSGGPLVCGSAQVGIVAGFNVNCSQSFYIDIRHYDYNKILEQMN